jgi:hypothetical protein
MEVRRAFDVCSFYGGRSVGAAQVRDADDVSYEQLRLARRNGEVAEIEALEFVTFV